MRRRSSVGLKSRPKRRHTRQSTRRNTRLPKRGVRVCWHRQRPRRPHGFSTHYTHDPGPETLLSQGRPSRLLSRAPYPLARAPSRPHPPHPPHTRTHRRTQKQNSMKSQKGGFSGQHSLDWLRGAGGRTGVVKPTADSKRARGCARVSSVQCTQCITVQLYSVQCTRTVQYCTTVLVYCDMVTYF